MANIDIEKKSGGTVWPWLLGLLLLIAVLAFIFWPRDNTRDEVAVTDNTEQRVGTSNAYATEDVTTTGTMAPAVRSYVDWATSISVQGEMGLDHQFTRTGLMNLADALAAVSLKAPNVNRQQVDNKLSRMRTMANDITDNWESTQHADKIKRAFQASVDVFDELQQSSFPNLNGDVASVRQAVEQMDTNTLTLDQKNKVKDVFRESADVLEKMSRNLGS
ncbi:hypothetical protein GCM10023187_14240 [Nibrella viscosa]|uniref:Uncharacterized protein n=1 Tax=Nibrella viscosa TaxID=1084524 RepID=A0ABP8K605_9BACT